MEFGYCKYLLRGALCRMDTSIKLKRELFANTKKGEIWKIQGLQETKQKVNLNLCILHLIYFWN